MVEYAAAGQPAPAPPEGLVALLFTDIEGSTRLAAALGTGWPEVLSVHHALVGGAIAAEGGFVDGTEGDAFFATFSDPIAAARAAVSALRGLRAKEWPEQVGELRVRMGLHVGRVQRAATGYVGLEVHRAARVAAAAHGGQLLLTASARAPVDAVVPTEPLGLHRLNDFPGPEQLFCAVVDDRGAAAFPPPRTSAYRPNNLPAGSPVLIGRGQDIVRVRDALLFDHDRLVTLTGRGGVGKTSLAIATGSELLDEHPGGVWLVRLATVGSPAQVLPEVANALGARREPDQAALEAIVDRLGGRGAALIILDNFEHLLSAAPQIAELLDELLELRLLITSQAPLRLSTERCLPTETLDDEAGLLLIEREVGRRGDSLAVQAGERETLLDVVRLLDGLPLALELAAARLGLLSPTQLRDRLQESTRLLQEAAPDRPERQHSLRATVDWTLHLLDVRARALFTRLGAFAGPVEIEEIESVAAGDGLDVLQDLGRLLDVALVRRVEPGDGRVLFGLPEALRQIAAELLDASADGDIWRRAHARRQRDIAWAARATGDAAWDDYQRAVAGDKEAAAALRWANTSGDPVAAPLGAARAALLADLGRVPEALALLEPLLGSPSGDPAADAQALHSYAYALLISVRYDEALAAVDRALEIAPDAATKAKAMMLRGLVQLNRHEIPAAVRDSEHAAALARTVGPALHSGLLMMEAQARMVAGEADKAAELLRDAERIGASVDTTRLRSRYGFHAELARLAGRPEEALEWMARSLETWQDRAAHFTCSTI